MNCNKCGRETQTMRIKHYCKECVKGEDAVRDEVHSLKSVMRTHYQAVTLAVDTIQTILGIKEAPEDAVESAKELAGLIRTSCEVTLRIANRGTSTAEESENQKELFESLPNAGEFGPTTDDLVPDGQPVDPPPEGDPEQS